MEQIKLQASGKINITLDVTGAMDNHFHSLDMCMTTVNISDIVTIRQANTIQVSMNGESAGVDNSAYRAVVHAVDAGFISGAVVAITKGIPYSSGMGGSSVDAAAVLYAIARFIGVTVEEVECKGNRYYRMDTADSRYAKLEEIGARLGSDVVYLMQGGLVRASGKGDNLIGLPYTEHKFLVIVAEGGALTSSVFREYDKSPQQTNYTEQLMAGLPAGDITVGNGLTNAAIAVNPNIAIALEDMSKYTSKACMSGSGSAVFGVFDNDKDMLIAMRELSPKYKFCRLATSTPTAMIEIDSD